MNADNSEEGQAVVTGELSLSSFQNSDRMAEMQAKYYGAFWLGRRDDRLLNYDSSADFLCSYTILPTDGLEFLEARFSQPDRAYVEYEASPIVIEQALDILEHLRLRKSRGVLDVGSYPMYQRMVDAEEDGEGGGAKVGRRAERTSGAIVAGLGGLVIGALAATSVEHREFFLAPPVGIFLALGYVTMLTTAWIHRRSRDTESLKETK